MSNELSVIPSGGIINVPVSDMEVILDGIHKEHIAGSGDNAFAEAAYNLFEEFRRDYYDKEWRRLDENVKIYQGTYWDNVPKEKENGDIIPRSCTPIITSVIENIKADLADEMPEAIIKPDAAGKTILAKILTKVIAQELDTCDFERSYSAASHDFLQDGWTVFEVGHDPYLNQGNGGAFIQYIANKNFMCDPQTTDLQDGRACFVIDKKPYDWFRQRYPDQYPYMSGDPDLIDDKHDTYGSTTEPSQRRSFRLIEMWVKEYDPKTNVSKIHFAKFAGGQVLENSAHAYGDSFSLVASCTANAIVLKNAPTTEPVAGNTLTIRGGGSDAHVKYLELYYSRLFAAGDPDAPSRLYWSAVIGDGRTIEDWLSVDGSTDASGGYVEVGESAFDDIIGITALSNQILVFKRFSVWRLYGDRPSTFTVERIDKSSDTVSNAGVIVKYDAPYFLMPNGIHYYDSTTIVPVDSGVRYLRRFFETIKDVSKSKGVAANNHFYLTCRTSDDAAYDNAIITYDVATGAYAGIILIIIYTGMRYGELMTIRTENIHLDKSYMLGGIKSEAGKNREIPLLADIKPLVKSLMIDKPLPAVSDTTFRKHYDRALSTAGIAPHTIHECRHTAPTLLARAGVQPGIIMEIMGHSSYGQTMEYTHPTLQDKLDAMQAGMPKRE